MTVDTIHQRVRLQRQGEPDAQAALFSLPMPRGLAAPLAPGIPGSGSHPLAWWRRGLEPRRVLCAVATPPGGSLPESLSLRAAASQGDGADSPADWRIDTPLTTERIPYKAHAFTDIDSLRGVPAADCTTMEYGLDLSWGGRRIRLQPGATGPGTAECLWQNVEVDRLWRHDAAEAIRVGGIIYNEDTYLWADLYLILFTNGVAAATLHLTNGKLHPKGYDFRGLPYLKISGAGVAAVDAAVPRDGWRADLGVAQFNFADTAIICSDREPSRLRSTADAVYYHPFSRIVNAQCPEAPEQEWAPGFARTLRFQFSLGQAPPAVARYQAPGWWHAICGEPWEGGYLPVRGRFAPVARGSSAHVRDGMRRGAFDGGSLADLGGAGNDGGAGAGMMQQAYLSGDAGEYRDALDYCTYWADLAVDHTDFSVHQWLGGWGWKTCAYTKFRDVLFAYLETGDPWMLDTAEMVADTYWAWFRSNWPRNSIGRDAFELGGWVLMWRYLGTEQARERTLELLRMVASVLASRGAIGGQMGAGPHPGWHASLYMTGVVFAGVLEALEAATEAGVAIDSYRATLASLHHHNIRDDVELFPVSLGKSNRSTWIRSQHQCWSLPSLHAYAAMGRLYGADERVVHEGFRKLRESLTDEPWGPGRAGDQHLHPHVHDALMLGARLGDDGESLHLTPLFGPETLPWPPRQDVETPWGILELSADDGADGLRLTLTATASFPVHITTTRGESLTTDSTATITLPR